MVLTLDEVKEHLRIEGEAEDGYIQTLIQQSQAAAENFCRVKFEESVSDEVVVESPIKLAILLMVAYLYENRDTPDRTIYGTMRIAFENLLYPYRDPEKMF